MAGAGAANRRAVRDTGRHPHGYGAWGIALALGRCRALVFIGGLSTGGIWLAFSSARMFLWAVLPPVVYDTVRTFALTLIAAGFAGEMLASLMTLYLSHAPDNGRLKRIQAAIRGPYGRRMLVKAALVLGVALPFALGLWEH